MKFPLHLLPSDRKVVLSAMDEYMEHLGGQELKMFDIAYQNVFEQKEHDGMSFKYIISALIESDSDTDDLILWVEHAFKRHQRINGPKKKGKFIKQDELLSFGRGDVGELTSIIT